MTLTYDRDLVAPGRARPSFPRMAVGVMGSAGGTLSEDVRERVRRLGAAIGRRGHTLITGACPGLPQEAVLTAKEHGGCVVGISPAHSVEEHVVKYRSPIRGYDVIIYTGNGLMGREIENIRSCDVVIFAGGSSGTLGEFAIAYEEGKIIGVLQSTGGIADHMDEILAIVNKKTDAVVCSNADPDSLMTQLELAYETRVLPARLLALRGRCPDGELDP